MRQYSESYSQNISIDIVNPKDTEAIQEIVDNQKKLMGWTSDIEVIPFHDLVSGILIRAKNNNGLVGFARLKPTSTNKLLLSAIGVEKTVRGQKIGEQLFDKIVTVAKDQNVQYIYRTFNPFNTQASNLYLNKSNAIPVSFHKNLYNKLGKEITTPRFKTILDVNNYSKEDEVNQNIIELTNLETQNNLDNQFLIEIPNISLENETTDKIQFVSFLEKVYNENYIVSNFTKKEDKNYFLLEKKNEKEINSLNKIGNENFQKVIKDIKGKLQKELFRERAKFRLPAGVFTTAIALRVLYNFSIMWSNNNKNNQLQDNKINKFDLEFSKKNNTPLPNSYYSTRIKENFARMFPSLEVRETTCAISGKKIKTTLPPELNGRILDSEIFLQETN